MKFDGPTDGPADGPTDGPTHERGGPPGPEEVGVAPLPEAVRSRVLALAADALGKVPPEDLPPALKKVAGFAPARRARLAGTQIAGVLASDERFRESLALQVQAMSGELAAALLQGRPPAAADPVEAAATAYLLRSPGWQEVVARADATLRSDRRLEEAQRSEEQARRLHRRVTQLEEELDRQRRDAKEQLDRLRREHRELRSRLGEARARLRQAESVAQEQQRDTERSLAEAARAQTSGEAEVRRLRARVAELEAGLGTARRGSRADRVSGTVRARLLLDTLSQAAQGLQRELNLPAVEVMPADTVAAPATDEGTRVSTGRASLATDDPALLEELLRLPRAHLVVDGYNVTKTSWPELPLDRQRERLLTGTAALAARTRAEVTVVFDAADSSDRPLVTSPRGVRVRFSPYGVIADDVIRDLVAAEPPGRAVVVVSSDQEVVRDVLAAGFRVVASGALTALLRGSRA